MPTQTLERPLIKDGECHAAGDEVELTCHEKAICDGIKRPMPERPALVDGVPDGCCATDTTGDDTEDTFSEAEAEGVQNLLSQEVTALQINKTEGEAP